jgi:hypothetical protein
MCPWSILIDALGAGWVATGCPEGAIAMENKPGFPVPPKTVKELVRALKSTAQGQNR